MNKICDGILIFYSDTVNHKCISDWIREDKNEGYYWSSFGTPSHKNKESFQFPFTKYTVKSCSVSIEFVGLNFPGFRWYLWYMIFTNFQQITKYIFIHFTDKQNRDIISHLTIHKN